MSYEWLEEYCCAKAGVVKDYKVEWEVFRYMVGGKMFVMQGHNKEKRPIISLKCEPLLAKSLRDEHEDIIPGYYLNKEHWNSIYEDGDVSDELMKRMVDMSYELVFKTLTLKMRKEIEGDQN